MAALPLVITPVKENIVTIKYKEQILNNMELLKYGSIGIWPMLDVGASLHHQVHNPPTAVDQCQ